MSCERSAEVGSLFLPVPVVPEFRGAPRVRAWWQIMGYRDLQTTSLCFFLRPHFTDKPRVLSATQLPGTSDIPSIDTPGICKQLFHVFYFLPFPNPL